MQFYGMTDTQVLDMPIRRFWMLHRNIDRIAAEQDMRALMVAGNSQSGEAARDFLKRMQERVGEIVSFGENAEEREFHPVRDAVRDRAGFNDLKSMGKVV